MRPWGLLLAALLLLPFGPVAAVGGEPVVSIIIDDLGDRLNAGHRVIALPGPVACAFLPHVAHTSRLAREAHAAGKEVLLHLPMETVEGRNPGPGALTLHMDHAEFLSAIDANLQAVPHVVGVNNHMGSLLTRHPGHMTWLMRELKARGGLFFVDSRTSAETVAEQMAQENGVPALRRHVFLDHDPSPAAVNAAFDRLITLARHDGAAVAIGHPYESTLRVLEARLPTLQAQGIRLISLSQMLAARKAEPRWQAAAH